MKNKLEEQLESLSFVDPSTNYHDKVLKNLKSNKQLSWPKNWNFALALLLVISIGLNLLQNSNSNLPSNQIKVTSKVTNDEQPKYSINYGVTAPGITKSNIVQIWEIKP